MKIAAVVMLLLTGCASAPSSSGEDVRVIIQRANDDLESLYARGDIDAAVVYFSENAWQMPPNQPALVGREAIRQFWKQAVQFGKWQFTLETQSVDVSGSMAVERGKYVLAFAAGPTAPFASFTDHGNYLVQWRRESDGRWRVVADAPVSDLPMASPK